MKTKILIGLLFAVVAGAAIGYYLYNKPHKNYEALSPDFTLNSKDLIVEFELDETAANEKYLNKMLLITGTVAEVTEIEGNEWTVALEDVFFGVTCTFASPVEDAQLELLKALQIGQAVTLKGRCDGKLTDIRLTQSSFH